MVVSKGTIDARTTIKNRKISKTDLGLDESFKALESYLRPMVNEYVNRRVMPRAPEEGTVVAVTRITIRETKKGQTVDFNEIGIEQARI
jgi:hypothetical protein